jgi:hypothetical protein
VCVCMCMCVCVCVCVCVCAEGDWSTGLYIFAYVRVYRSLIRVIRRIRELIAEAARCAQSMGDATLQQVCVCESVLDYLVCVRLV